MDYQTRRKCHFLMVVISGMCLGLARGDDMDVILDELKQAQPEEKIPETMVKERLAEIRANPKARITEYLERYGYMGKDAKDDRLANLQDEATFSEALARFQRSAGLRVTGAMDEETIQMMSVPRCGNKDPGAGRGFMGGRSKRYALRGYKWRQSVLTYKILNGPRNSNTVDGKPVDQIMARAFKVWSDVANLEFRPVSRTSRADIDVSFNRRSHGDGNPFDGRGGTLAHAFFPGSGRGGDAHFDDEEIFSERRSTNTNLFQVAAHEFGHSLGLEHSDVSSALMAPYYRGYQPNFRLHSDDIRAIRALYGAQTGSATQPPPTQNPTERPEVTRRPTPNPTSTRSPGYTRPTTGACRIKFDAITSMGSVTLGFSGDQYYTGYGNQRMGNPRRISDSFRGVSRVDAAVALPLPGRSRYALILFEGNKGYMYLSSGTNHQYQANADVRRIFPRLPDTTIDAIFQWRNGRIYIFVGDQCYKYGLTSGSSQVAFRFERLFPLRYWGLGSTVRSVSSVVQYTNGKTYFFHGEDYVRYNDDAYRIDRANPPYPRKTADWWINCQNRNYQQGVSTAMPFDSDNTEDQTEDTEFILIDTVLHEGVSGTATSLSSLVLISTCVFLLLTQFH